jgi:hypothetical protein
MRVDPNNPRIKFSISVMRISEFPSPPTSDPTDDVATGYSLIFGILIFDIDDIVAELDKEVHAVMCEHRRYRRRNYVGGNASPRR